MNPPHLIAISGSPRAESWNKKLAFACGNAAEALGAKVTYIDLAKYDLPLYNGDTEKLAGFPAAALELKSLWKSADGMLIASPEFNGSLTGSLKNLIDWLSRTLPEEQPMECFKGKVAGIMCATPGALGGVRGLGHLRDILGYLGTLVVPTQWGVGRCFEVFDKSGAIIDDQWAERIPALAKEVVDYCTMKQNYTG